MEELHVADVVDIDLLLQNYYEALPVKLNGEDGRGKGELADGGLSLLQVSRSSPWKRRAS